MEHDLSHIRFVGADPASEGVRYSKSALAVNRLPASVLPPRTRAPRSIAEPESMIMDAFAAWVLRQAGLDERAYRPEAMRRRVPACLRKLRVGSETEAKALLEKNPELIQAAVDALLIGVTEFFRDPGVFETLRREVLPELLRVKPGLRVYSAGVSEGHELYSMAMLLAEAGVLDQSELLGVDCRPEAIARAESGCFGEEDFEKLDTHWRETYFRNESDEQGWCVRPALRGRIRWALGDLFSFSGGRLWDVILFRNVVIYFGDQHASAAWEKLYSQLAPGGVMITGTADRPPGNLHLVRVASSIYKKPERE